MTKKQNLCPANSMAAAGRARPAVLAALVLTFASPAQAISFSTGGLLWAFLVLGWPWVLPGILWVLAAQWKRRAERPRRLIATSIVCLLGTTIWLGDRVPTWRDEIQHARIHKEWRRIDAAVVAGQFDRALELIADHPSGDARSYLLRAIEREDSAPNVAFASTLFRRCVSLLERAPGSTGNNLLGPAVQAGRHELVRAWLTSESCSPADGQDRAHTLVGRLQSLVPYPPDPKTAKPGLAQGQALTLRELVVRYPILLRPQGPENCRASPRKCTLIAQVFARRHLQAVQALVPLDDRLDEHVPPVIAHILRNDVSRATELARHEFYAIHHDLPSLFATAPFDALRAALKTTPINEQAFLDDDERKTQFQRLHPIVESAETRDAGQPEWTFLNLLLDQFPKQLARLDPALVDGYAGGEAPRTTQGRQLMRRLRAAGMDCKALQGMVGWGYTEREDGIAAMAVVGCEPPAGWSPYVPRSR